MVRIEILVRRSLCFALSCAALAGCQVLADIDTKTRPTSSGAAVSSAASASSASSSTGSGGGGGDATCGGDRPVNFETDAKHCGDCDHDCFDASCVGARCAGPVTVVPQQAKSFLSIVVAGGGVFWIDEKTDISYSAIDGKGFVSTFWHGDVGASVLRGDLDSNFLVWTTQSGDGTSSSDGDVFRLRIDMAGGAPTALNMGSPYSGQGDITVVKGDNGQAVYALVYGEPGASYIQEIGAAKPLRTASSDPRYISLASDAEYIYYADGSSGDAMTGEIGSLPIVAGDKDNAAIIDASTIHPGALVADGDQLYWSDADTIYTKPKGAPSSQTPDHVCVTGSGRAVSIAVASDAGIVYYATRSPTPDKLEGILGSCKGPDAQPIHLPLPTSGDPTLETQPNDVLLVGDWLYVATTAGIYRYDVRPP